MNPNPLRPSVSKQLLIELLLKKRNAILPIEECSQLTFSLKGESLHIEGPRKLLDKLARRLRKAGSAERKNPYGA